MKFIFQVHLRPGHTIEEYAETWIRASEILQSAPGARGTLLHRKIGDPSTLLAIASWDSKAERDAREAFLQPDSAMRKVLDAHLGIVDFELIGEFEEPEWIVAPRKPARP
jgi:heme-degrading monooxygenase HmoA